MRTAIGLPPELAKGGVRILRPRDAAHVYAQPWSEFRRLADLGVLRRVATGYYAVAPLSRIGDKRWRPSIEAIALGIAKADYEAAEVALMGVSAARQHGVLPRSINIAVVAGPKQRPLLNVSYGRVTFVKRDVSRLEVERVDTELGSGWVTTVEQTLLDLAARPLLGGLAESDLASAIRGLYARAKSAEVKQLAEKQHKPRALTFINRVLG